MRALWQRIERVLEQRWPNKRLELRPPASARQVEEAESQLGVRFPEDFRESLLVHDGQDGEPELLWLPGVHKLGSLESMVRCWQEDRRFFEAEDGECFAWLDHSQRVRQVHAHPQHISFAGSSFWDYDRLLFDFDPAPLGKAGQIIVRFDCELVFLCESWRELMEKTAEGLENGRITLHECGPELSHQVRPSYLSPKRARTVSFFDYYASAWPL